MTFPFIILHLSPLKLTANVVAMTRIATTKKERDRHKHLGKNALIVYKTENPAITIFLLKQMLKCFRNHINMYLTTESGYFMTAFTSIYLLIAFFVVPTR